MACSLLAIENERLVPSRVTVLPGSNLVLTCDSATMLPAWSFKKLAIRKMKHFNSRYVSYNKLLLYNLSKLNEGAYGCQGGRAGKKVLFYAEMMLFVKGKSN